MAVFLTADTRFGGFSAHNAALHVEKHLICGNHDTETGDACYTVSPQSFCVSAGRTGYAPILFSQAADRLHAQAKQWEGAQECTTAAD